MIAATLLLLAGGAGLFLIELTRMRRSDARIRASLPTLPPPTQWAGSRPPHPPWSCADGCGGTHARTSTAPRQSPGVPCRGPAAGSPGSPYPGGSAVNDRLHGGLGGPRADTLSPPGHPPTTAPWHRPGGDLPIWPAPMPHPIPPAPPPPPPPPPPPSGGER